jgi:hypothetical protein
MARTSYIKTYFSLEESPYQPGYNTIDISEEKIHIGPTSGSRNVFMARLMNLSWANFLRLCRDKYGAKLIGKNCIYVVPYFPVNEDGGRRLCRELNARMAQVFSDLDRK